MSALARKEVLRTAVRTVAAEAADATCVEAFAGSARGYGGSSVVVYQCEDGIARLTSPQIAPPPGLSHPNEIAGTNAKSLAQVASCMSKKDALALSVGSSPPPGLHDLHTNQASGKTTKSLANVASYMSKKDAQKLSAAIAPPPGLPAPNEVAAKSNKTWPLAHVASNMSKKDARALSMAVAGTPAPGAANVKAKSPGITLQELIQCSSEKYDLNMEFWEKYNDISGMALATDKTDILEIVENFALIHRKHAHLFQRLKSTVVRSIDAWNAPELAALCHAWAQLGFKHEDLCVAMADRVAATVNLCAAQELCWIWDAYASVRVTIPCVTEAVTLETYKKVDEFSVEQLCNHASSYARLNLAIAPLFKKIGDRLVQLINEQLQATDVDNSTVLSARALSLAAYSFAKLGFSQPDVFQVVASGSLPLARNFTAKDLQMIMVAFAQAQHYNGDLIEALSAQALRRIAQFNAESLALTLRSLASFRHRDNVLLDRVVEQLPRMTPTFRPIDIVTTLNAFASLQVHNSHFFNILTPTVVEQASLFTQSDWVSALQGYSSLGCRDEGFLAAFSGNLQTPRLTFQQIATMMSGCASLSFTQVNEQLAVAATSKMEREGVQMPVDTAAQMYSALALLGSVSQGSTESPKVEALLSSLFNRLSAQGTANELSARCCLDLCYALLVAPPKDDDPPVKVSDLLERLESEAGSFSQEEQLLLGHMHRASKLPWNRNALFPLHLEQLAAEVKRDSGHADLPLAFFSSVVGALAPHLSAWSPLPSQSRQDAFLCGVHAAVEVREGLEDISATLRMHDIQHSIMTDNLPVGAFIDSNFGPGQISTRFVWGSSVHYVEGADGTRHRLVPAAQFQVAALQAEADATVLVVPHWSWPMEGDRESKARCLLNLAQQHRGSERGRSSQLMAL